jgi:spermidine synthase
MNLRLELWIAIFVLSFLLVGARARRRQESMPWLYILFFCSGFPALIYQIVWQRALFSIYGVNIESVTIVVSAFMFGLGAGSLIGGALSRNSRLPLLRFFAAAELGIAGFGMLSLGIFRWAAESTAGSPPLQTGLFSFALVVIPTVLMGATLPLLVEHVVRRSRNVGFAVGGLYFVNTLGSAVACFVAGDVLMRVFGLLGSVRIAASINFVVGIAVLVYSMAETQSRNAIALGKQYQCPWDASTKGLLPFRLGVLCAGFAGFLALAYEIIWYRMLAFATGGIAREFAFLLGSYLLGIAGGSRFIERYCSRRADRQAMVRVLGMIMAVAALVSFAVGPLFAFVVQFGAVFTLGGESIQAYMLFLPLICLGAFFFGATFPLICHVSVGENERAGSRLSYLYAANILGSTAGSFLVGFVLMDYVSLQMISTMLMLLGTSFALWVLAGSNIRRMSLQVSIAAAAVSVTAAIFISQPILASIYDRLYFKKIYPRFHFSQVVETRDGVVAVTPDGTLYGGGAYDGHFNTDLFHDVNMILRPYALSALHAAPRRVLMIGLGSGSWAQVVANNPEVNELTVVEINAGYFPLIRTHSNVASLLHNPKVHIVIDDGRRWMLRNREARFDAIVMNTMLHWRDHSTNLLSQEFVQLAREHLNPGGVFFYNTTSSDEAVATALSVFSYGLRVENSIAVSDSPIHFDRARWKSVLLNYSIDGKQIVDRNTREAMTGAEHLTNIPEDPTGMNVFSIETNEQLRRRLQNVIVITDDNMLTEWRG